MGLNLNPAAPAADGKGPAAGTASEAASSDFARILERHFGQGMETGTDRDLTGIQDRPEEPADRTVREARAVDRSERDNSQPSEGSRKGAEGKPAGTAVSQPGQEYEAPAPETSLGLAALAGFTTPLGLAENGNATGLRLPALDSIPGRVRAQVAGQIAAGFSDRQGVQTLTLQLEPEHLGKVDVRMRAEGERLTVRLSAANREAETALRENIKDLTDAIRDRTGKYQQVDVRVELKSPDDREAGGFPRETKDQQSRHRSGGQTGDGPGRDHAGPREDEADPKMTSGSRTQEG